MTDKQITTSPIRHSTINAQHESYRYKTSNVIPFDLEYNPDKKSYITRKCDNIIDNEDYHFFTKITEGNQTPEKHNNSNVFLLKNSDNEMDRIFNMCSIYRVIKGDNYGIDIKYDHKTKIYSDGISVYDVDSAFISLNRCEGNEGIIHQEQSICNNNNCDHCKLLKNNIANNKIIYKLDVYNHDLESNCNTSFITYNNKYKKNCIELKIFLKKDRSNCAYVSLADFSAATQTKESFDHFLEKNTIPGITDIICVGCKDKTNLVNDKTYFYYILNNKKVKPVCSIYYNTTVYDDFNKQFTDNNEITELYDNIKYILYLSYNIVYNERTICNYNNKIDKYLYLDIIKTLSNIIKHGRLSLVRLKQNDTVVYTTTLSMVNNLLKNLFYQK